ncbi:MAG: ABC transporter ATP-binding protein [Chloroflexota bacterium]|nr:ABC transporter ATP-binding protein [Chloroflexota bacterium]
MLEVRGVGVRYGHVEALRGVSLSVDDGEIVTVIGANGAGKTSLLNAISGLVPLSEGEILFQGRRISGMSPQEVVQLGISQVPEGRQLFAQLTVMDNLMLGCYPRFIRNWNLWSGYVSYLKGRPSLSQDAERVFGVFPRLEERRRQLAGSLSGGEQQMLAVGRALMSRPTLLLLDEPSMGLAPLLVKDILVHLQRLRSEGLTLLLVEQNANQALKVADRGYAFERGTVRVRGSSAELLANEEVRSAYLGSKQFSRAG